MHRSLKWLSIITITLIAVSSGFIYMFYIGQLGFIDPDISIGIICTLITATSAIGAFTTIKWMRMRRIGQSKKEDIEAIV